MTSRRTIPISAPPERDARLVADLKPELLLSGEHHLCPGCGEPLAVRVLLDTLSALSLQRNTIGVVGIGCYTSFSQTLDVDLVQALHGRAPSVATGVKRMLADTCVFTLQGDGDMVSEGLQEVLHTAARGERITCVLLNNGVFGETGGHMTATTVIGQRTKNTIDGRDAHTHGHPLLIGDLLAQLTGTVYAARGSVHDAGHAAQTRRYLRRAVEHQMAGDGFTFVEVLTMCPTGWFVPTADAPEYLNETLAGTHLIGELKVDGRVTTTEERRAEQAGIRHPE
jgi:2-oxoglutarate ferredoxin oxidoreductase subunit beta